MSEVDERVSTSSKSLPPLQKRKPPQNVPSGKFVSLSLFVTFLVERASNTSKNTPEVIDTERVSNTSNKAKDTNASDYTLPNSTEPVPKAAIRGKSDPTDSVFVESVDTGKFVKVNKSRNTAELNDSKQLSQTDAFYLFKDVRFLCNFPPYCTGSSKDYRNCSRIVHGNV